MSFEHFDETPAGDCIIKKYKNDVEQVKLIRDDVLHLIEDDGLLPRQIVILIRCEKRDSCLADVKQLGKYPLKSAYRLKDIRDNDVMYATIGIFKGLESDVVFLADLDLIGIPHRIVIGERGLADGNVEYKARADDTGKDIALSEIVELVKSSIQA